MSYSLKMSGSHTHKQLIDELFSDQAQRRFDNRKKKEERKELKYQIELAWKEADLDKALESVELNDLKLLEVEKMAKKAKKKALQAASRYEDIANSPLEEPEHMAKRRKLKQDLHRSTTSAEALEAARAAGAAPPVGSWWERTISYGCNIGLGGFGAWLSFGS